MSETPSLFAARNVVQFSTGLGSAEVLRRVAETYGRESVLALTADIRCHWHDSTHSASAFFEKRRVGDMLPNAR